jgi:hypothetical protein
MARQGVYLDQATTPATVLATRPTTVAHGVDISAWTADKVAPVAVVCLLDGSEAATVADPTGGTGGVELWGYIQSKWYLLGYLNNGDDVPIAGDDGGFAAELGKAGIGTRLAIAGTASAGTVTYSFAPMEEI